MAQARFSETLLNSYHISPSHIFEKESFIVKKVRISRTKLSSLRSFLFLIRPFPPQKSFPFTFFFRIRGFKFHL